MIRKLLAKLFGGWHEAEYDDHDYDGFEDIDQFGLLRKNDNEY